MSCFDLGPLLQIEPHRDCEADECPEDTQLAEHDAFRFKVGRASLGGMPLAGRKLADNYGCEVVAAFVNIGSEGDDGPIYREFLFVGRHAGCRFDVAQGNLVKTAMIDRRLAIDRRGRSARPVGLRRATRSSAPTAGCRSGRCRSGRTFDVGLPRQRGTPPAPARRTPTA